MRFSSEIEIENYIYDHHFEGRCVLPAVEALITLAKVVQAGFPNINIRCLNAARFSRFLIIPPGGHPVPVIVEANNTPDGGISARLMTSVRSRTGGIGRSLEHARVEFPLIDSPQNPVPPLPVSDNPQGSCLLVPQELIYPGLIPFGKAFQNIIGPVSVWPGRASALLSGGDCEMEYDGLGSPFPFDAAFHIACVWGQRFTGQVLFPVGFEKRTIQQKTKGGNRYLCWIIPSGEERNVFLFDALIMDESGGVCEEIRGIQMQDVSQGRLLPPLWIKTL
jgi:hypothetical protein